MISIDLVQAIIDQHPLRGRNSIHYVDHWARVLSIGRKLAAQTGARLDVVELFCVFHDSGRWNDGSDPQHGERGAALAETMHDRTFHLDREGLDFLLSACRDHSLGFQEADITVQTCWDSDRLDLGRAAIKPNPKRLCTPAARDEAMIRWANERSILRIWPENILAEWGIPFRPDDERLRPD